MNKLTYTQIKKQLKECKIGYDYETIKNTPYVGFLSRRDWDHGYDAIYGYNGSRREFYCDLFQVLKCIKEYAARCNIEYFIVSPLYHCSAFVPNYLWGSYYNDIVFEITNFLKANNINPKTQSGAVVDANDMMTISMIIEGAFRGASLLCLFAPQRGVVIQPDHHFQTTFFTAHPDREIAIIGELLKDNSYLEMYTYRD